MNSTFTDNQARDIAGAALVFTSGVFADCTFTNNVASTSGGAVRVEPLVHNPFVANSTTLQAEFDNCTFENNRIANFTGEPRNRTVIFSGGAIYLFGSSSIRTVCPCHSRYQHHAHFFFFPFPLRCVQLGPLRGYTSAIVHLRKITSTCKVSTRTNLLFFRRLAVQWRQQPT
jgi:predicted outer membrane repeat protein